MEGAVNKKAVNIRNAEREKIFLQMQADSQRAVLLWLEGALQRHLKTHFLPRDKTPARSGDGKKETFTSAHEGRPFSQAQETLTAGEKGAPGRTDFER
jgi:hypothetical protein